MAENQGQPPANSQQENEAVSPTTRRKLDPANITGAWEQILPQSSLQVRPQAQAAPGVWSCETSS